MLVRSAVCWYVLEDVKCEWRQLTIQLNGWASYTFGYRRTYICAMTAMIATIFIPVFAVNLPMLLAGNFINGIPWGGEYN